MKFIKTCFEHQIADLKVKWWKYTIYSLTMLLFIIDGSIAINKSEILNPNITDLCVYIYGGIKEYVPSLTELFRVPFAWLLIHFIPLMFSSNINNNEFSVYGQQRIYRIGDRKKWWFEKCSHTTSFIIKLYFIAFLEITIYALVFRLEITPFCSNEIGSLVDFGDNAVSSINLNLLFESTILPLLFTLSLSHLQSALSLWIKPTIALIISSILLFLSAYYVNPWVIGNYSMAMRSIKIVSNGVDSIIGLIIYICIIIISLVLGAIRIQNYDILTREEKHEGSF